MSPIAESCAIDSDAPAHAEIEAIYAAVCAHDKRRFGSRVVSRFSSDFRTSEPVEAVIFDMHDTSREVAIVRDGKWTPEGRDATAVIWTLRG